MPELNYLKSILDYNPDTGEFTWKVDRGGLAKAGNIAGSLVLDKRDFNSKYYYIMADRKMYKLHRLAYFYVTGTDPGDMQIDHINGNTLDNRFENLRLATNAQNSKNYKKPITNKSGFKGVSWCKQNKKWYAQIKVNNKKIYLGRYNSKLYAALVYARAAKKYFGEWRRV